jgi:hypothetical protein
MEDEGKLLRFGNANEAFGADLLKYSSHIGGELFTAGQCRALCSNELILPAVGEDWRKYPSPFLHQGVLQHSHTEGRPSAGIRSIL